ncbi:MAG: glycosyltransferase family 1 protein [Candidatus Omnitrophota bacterium]|jgi:glycosyltransferase involved in cell wall biosynthesis|nr:MAG: glycosyltransferase family 1 protein [Candidatus Omnitrophota bacterium]
MVKMINKGKKPKPRVLVCCGDMVFKGGLERMTFEVMRALKEKGAIIHCIVNSWENHVIIESINELGLPYSLGYNKAELTRRPRNILIAMHMFFDVIINSILLLLVSLKFRPTHILIPEYISLLRNMPGIIILRIFKARIVVRIANPPVYGGSKFYTKLWQFMVNPFVDRYLSNSEYTKNAVLKMGIKEDKVKRIYNCVPKRKSIVLTPAKKDFNKIIFVGQIIPEKGLDLLFDAVILLKEQGLNVTLDIIGQMEGWVSPSYVGYREDLLKRAAEPYLKDIVRFLGWQEDVQSFLMQSAIHCCPSRYEQHEGFGIVCIEAKNAGIPSVVTPSGALPELISHKQDGWLCIDFSASEIANGLKYFLEDKERLIEAGRQAKLSLSRFSYEKFAEEHQREFELEDK